MPNNDRPRIRIPGTNTWVDSTDLANAALRARGDFVEYSDDGSVVPGYVLPVEPSEEDRRNDALRALLGARVPVTFNTETFEVTPADSASATKRAVKRARQQMMGETK